MIYIIKKKVNSFLEWVHYWRNLPGKLELAEIEQNRLNELLTERINLLNECMSKHNTMKLEKDSLVKQIQSMKQKHSYLDAEYWNTKWQQRKVYYNAPRRVNVCDYLKYAKVQEIVQIADTIIEDNSITAEKVDDVPLYVLKWLEGMFKDKVFKYVLDSSENWQTPSTTLKIAQGDCDDFGILEYHIIREILIMLKVWDKHKHRLKCIAGNVNKYSTIPAPAGGHFYLVWLYKDGQWYGVESTYYRPKSILDFSVKPIKTNPAYGVIWFTFNDELSWAQHSITVSKEDFKKW